MMRSIMVVAVVAGLAYLFYSQPNKFLNYPITYVEARYEREIAGRQLELVAIGQRYDKGECAADSVVQAIYSICEGVEGCKQTKYECKSGIDQRYQNMLKAAPANTHYLHLTDHRTKLEGVVLVWGLSKKESKVFCSQEVENFQDRKLNDFSVECI